MTRFRAFLKPTICILAGIALIAFGLRRKPRKYITLSGHRDGQLWVRRMPA